MDVKVLSHPYIQAVLTELRDESTGQIEFRKSLVRLGRALGFEIIRDFELERVTVKTPLGVFADGVRIKDLDKVLIVTVLRAAWPMTEGLIKIFPKARQGIISARRVEEKGMKEDMSFDIDVEYVRLPSISPEDIIIIVDPMVATGSTIETVLKILSKRGKGKRYIVASAITTPVAIDRIRRVSEDLGLNITIYTAAIDPQINEKGYIVPGLGDAGDRAFGG
ncbi:MAG: uracil phosphoribosyltransferase [Desulfurococcaceae archaeon TW002]